MPQNLVEKIAQAFAVNLDEGQTVHSGDYISIRPAYVMTHDNTGAVIPKFRSIGAKKVANPRQPVYTLDHNVQDTGEANMAKYLAAKASWEAANACLQSHGGFGFAAEYDIERKFRETRLYQVAPISTNLILSYVAEHILGMPRSF